MIYLKFELAHGHIKFWPEHVKIYSCHSQSVCHQQFDDESLGFTAQVSEHTLLKSHIVVPDIEHGAAVIFSSKRRYSSQAEMQKHLLTSLSLTNCSLILEPCSNIITGP